MIIDILVLVLVVVAFFKGYSKGLIMAFFNTISLIIGLALAIKFSTIVSPIIAEKTGAGTYTPFLSFTLVFLAATLLIRLAGKAIEKTFELAQIGFANRLAGSGLYLLVYLSVISIFFYYLNQMGFLSENIKKESVAYPIISPWGPAVVDGIGFLIPWFKDMFVELGSIFDGIPVD
jgi:membrane protein required for colicin V production